MGGILLFSSIGKAQESSTKLWSAVEYKTELHKRWDAEFSQLFRLKEDLRTVDSHITEATLMFAPKKRWEIGAELRYLYRNDTKGGIQGFENMLRYRINLEKKFKVPHGNLSLRLGYQNRISLDRENRSKQKWRFRPSYEWKIKNWSLDPKFFFEALKTLEAPNEISYRYGVGSKKKLNKQLSLAFRYIFEQDVEDSQATANYHILALKVSFSKKKEKKKKTENPENFES